MFHPPFKCCRDIHRWYERKRAPTVEYENFILSNINYFINPNPSKAEVSPGETSKTLLNKTFDSFAFPRK